MGDPQREVTGAETLAGALRDSVQRVFDYEPGVRLGEDDEAVHQMRVGTRRIRSDLRVFERLFEREWARTLRRQVRPIADALGAVRDRDVLGQRLRRQLGALGAEASVGGDEILAGLARERDAARTILVAMLDEPAQRLRVACLQEAATEPRMAAKAGRPAAEVLPPRVRATWRELEQLVTASGRQPPPEELHQIRVAAKRARYAAELAARSLGEGPARFARAMAKVQDVLGEHQDAVVTEAWLRQVGVNTPPAIATTVDALVAIERDLAGARRSEWRSVWEEAADRDLRSWLRR